MNESRELLSVLIPVFNGAKYIGEALESAFAQNWERMEIVVVDDGSTDASAQVAAGFPKVRIVRQENRGLGNARNRCLEESKGEWIAFLDADDRWMPEKTELQMRVFEAEKNSDLVFANVRQFISPELTEEQRAQVRMTEEIIPGFVAGTMLARRGAFERVGKFREDIRLAETIDWLGRAREAGLREKMLPEVLLERRIHTTNTGIRERQSRGDYLSVLKAAMDRRRTGL